MKFFRDLAERTAASFAGGFLSVIGLDAANVLSLDWKAALGVGAGAALISLLKGVVARNFGNSDSASLSPKVGA
jgi:hypothetical protein